MRDAAGSERRAEHRHADRQGGLGGARAMQVSSPATVNAILSLHRRDERKTGRARCDHGLPRQRSRDRSPPPADTAPGGTIPIAPAALTALHLPRFPALAVCRRRPAVGEAASVRPASTNVHWSCRKTAVVPLGE